MQIDALTCKNCTYTAMDNCCLTSSDCAFPKPGGCDDGELPICDVSHKCVCGLIPPTPECTVANADTACATLLARCTECGATAVCDDGRCKIDLDSGASDQIFCAMNDTEHNFDRDAFFLCGIQVTSACLDACPAGSTQIPLENFDQSTCRNNTDGTQTCTLHCNCDYCDHDFNATFVDHQICCEARQTIDGQPAEFIECGGDARPICYSYDTGSETEAEACHEWGVNGGPTDAQSKADGCPTCDTPNGVPGEPTFDCNNFWTAAARVMGVCPSSACANLDATGTDAPGDNLSGTSSNSGTRKRQTSATGTCNDCGRSGTIVGNSQTPDVVCLRDCDGSPDGRLPTP